MTKLGGTKTMLLVVTFMGLTAAGDVPGARAGSARGEDPLQAPRSEDPQAPRDRGASSDEAEVTTAGGEPWPTK